MKLVVSKEFNEMIKLGLREVPKIEDGAVPVRVSPFLIGDQWVLKWDTGQIIAVHGFAKKEEAT